MTRSYIINSIHMTPSVSLVIINNNETCNKMRNKRKYNNVGTDPRFNELQERANR
jgi:hypothetical protein